MSTAENTSTQAKTSEVDTKKPKFCDKSAEGTVLTFKFGNDAEVVIDLSTLSEEIQQELMIHGALQKIGDSYASAGGDFAYGIACAEKVVENLTNGLWGAVRTGSGQTKSSGELVTALAQLQGKDVAEVAAALEAATDEQRKAVRSHPAVKAKIAELRAAKAAEALAKAGEAGKLSLGF